MQPRRLALAATAAVLLVISAPGGAADITVQPVPFAPHQSSATLHGALLGDQTIDYTLRARAGQTLSVRLDTPHSANYFNVLPPGSEAALFIGSTAGNVWQGALPADGEYRVRVYLMRSAARRKEAARFTLTVALAGQGDAGHGTPPDPAAGPALALAGSRWELVSIASLDDAMGTTAIDEPARYTLSFGADGRAAFRLDCNRASGPWQAEPVDDASGQLRFGPLATTRAMCPPPALDERIARDLPYVRTYLLRDGRLHMSLYADGGIYTWRRSAAAPR